MSQYNFNQRLDRSGTYALKWDVIDEGVIPMWVADMDFLSPEPVVRALRERAEHGVYGYTIEPKALRAAVLDRLERMYHWKVQPEELIFLPGVVTGFNLASQAVAKAGENIIVQPPVYPPFLHAHHHGGLDMVQSELVRGADGTYSIDFADFENTINADTRMFILCNPHNPVGRVFSQAELEQLAEICLRKNVIICSDEIHCDLVYSDQRHIPIASLSPEIARNTITLMAPSKTFNIAGLGCSFAVISNPDLRKKMERATHGLMHFGTNFMGYTAALAAYTEGQPWLDELLVYLEGNRNFMLDYIRREMPSVQVGVPEGTYLAWLDCRAAGITGSAGEFFLKQARVALNDGKMFGRGGEGFVRLNFGCPRDQLRESLERMAAVLRR